MEKFKEKLHTLRSEAETANKRADELRDKAQALETDHTRKDDELTKLVARVKELEEFLDTTENKLKEATTDFNEADLLAERLSKQTVKLELEVAVWDKKISDLETKYQTAQDEMKTLRELGDL